MLLKNARHEMFAQNLVSGQNATEAYRNAGFSDNRAAASRLRQDERIQRRVAELLEQRARKEAKATERAVENAGLTKQWVLERLVENVERALQAAPVVDGKGIPTGEYRYDGSVANRALELLGKEQGMFIERKESGAPGEFANMQSLQEVVALVRRELGDQAADALGGLLQADAVPEPTHEAGGAVN